MRIYEFDISGQYVDQITSLQDWLWTDVVEEPAAWLGVILLIAITYLQFRQNSEFHEWERKNSEREQKRLEKEAEDRRPLARVGVLLDGKLAEKPTIQVPRVVAARKTKEQIDTEVQAEYERVVQEFTGMSLDQYSLDRFMREYWDAARVGDYIGRYRDYLELENDRLSRWRFKFRFDVENFGKVALHDINTRIEISDCILTVMEDEDEKILNLKSTRPRVPKQRSQLEATLDRSSFGYLPPVIDTYYPPTAAEGSEAWRADERILAADWIESDLLYAVCLPSSDNQLEIQYSIHASEMPEAQTGTIRLCIEEVEGYSVPNFYDEE